jgi:cytochrome P450
MGGHDAVVLSHPDFFRHVLVEQGARYGKTRKDRPLFGNGLLTSEKEQWAAQRRACMKMLTARRQQSGEAIVRCVSDLIEAWREPGARDVVPDVDRFAIQALGDGFFGLDLPAHPGGAGLPAAVEALSGPGPLDRAAMAVVEDLAAHVARHRQPEAFFDQRDQITTFLLAGTETSATSLAWAMYLLASSPDVVQAIRRGDDAVVTAVVNEVLRLYPPLWIITREVVEADVIDGVALAPGTLVYLFVYRVQRDPRFWVEPDVFRPERFLNARPNAYAFVPFGIGPRVCAGRPFALQEMTVAIQAVAAAYDLRRPLDAPPVEPELAFTLRPLGPVVVEFTPAATIHA